jgi:hypothetical protein
MDFPHAGQVFFQISLDPVRQHGHSILPAFAVPDDDLIERKIDIFLPREIPPEPSFEVTLSPGGLEILFSLRGIATV